MYMKYILQLLTGAAVTVLIISCASGAESAGDKAYDMANRTQGDTRRTQLKTAYMNYRQAVMSNPDKVSTKLRNRFLDMCLVRIKMVLEEGNAKMDAIPLLMNDIEGQLKDDAQPEMRQRYAAFLVQMGDSSEAKERYIDALKYYDQAIEKAADATPFRDKRASIIRKVAEENYQTGMMEFEMGQKEKDESQLIRAEYFAKVALYFDSTYKDALKLLSEAYKANINTHSAYLTVVTDYTDTLMFRRINKYDILLAIYTQSKGGVIEVRMYSNTYNPLRMKSQDFALVDVNGKKYPAASGDRLDPEILDQEREALYRLKFPTPSAPVKKLIYQNGDHYSEKNFF
jgi:tetratricopeptide (TPR) repeat protein